MKNDKGKVRCYVCGKYMTSKNGWTKLVLLKSELRPKKIPLDKGPNDVPRYRCKNTECEIEFVFIEDEVTAGGGKYHYPKVNDRLFTFDEIKLEMAKQIELVNNPVAEDILEKYSKKRLPRLYKDRRTLGKSVSKEEILRKEIAKLKRIGMKYAAKIEKIRAELELKRRELREELIRQKETEIHLVSTNEMEGNIPTN